MICAEGYLFELERRGYVQAGPYVPEVVLDAPEAVRQLHREFVRAGSAVVEAFTYYGHREKLKVIGKEDILEPLKWQALQIAKEVADESGMALGVPPAGEPLLPRHVAPLLFRHRSQDHGREPEVRRAAVG